MTDKHTPGPWFVPGRPDKVCVKGYTKNGFARVIATAAEPTWMRLDEPSANAHLIAAAPELLDALRDCREACLVGDDDGISVSEDVVIPADLFDRICAAIAKATGSDT